MSDSSCDTQLVEWLRGNPRHNVFRNECCPDFSCCQPNLLWCLKQRREFVEASDEKREQMLFISLGSALEELGKRDSTYIAGLDGSASEGE